MRYKVIVFSNGIKQRSFLFNDHRTASLFAEGLDAVIVCKQGAKQSEKNDINEEANYTPEKQDPSREAIISTLCKYWDKMPRLRFGQLIQDIFEGSDTYYLTDEEALKKITDFSNIIK